MIGAVGNINLDIFLKTKSLPRWEEAILSEETYVSGGGSAANFAVAVRRLGYPVKLFACVGSSLIGKILLKDLEDEEVDVSCVKIIKGKNSGLAIIVVNSETGARLMLEDRGANKMLSPELFEEKCFEGLRALHFSSVDPQIVQAFLEYLKEQVEVISYDPGGIYISKLRRMPNVLSSLTIFFLNETEFQKLSLTPSFLLGKGIKEVVIKMGDKGAQVFYKNGVEKFKAFKVQVRDTTGAGDSFNAGYIAARLSSLTIKEALTFANAVAGLKVERKGGRSSPTLQEVLVFLEKNGFNNLVNKVKRMWRNDY